MLEDASWFRYESEGRKQVQSVTIAQYMATPMVVASSRFVLTPERLSSQVVSHGRQAQHQQHAVSGSGKPALTISARNHAI